MDYLYLLWIRISSNPIMSLFLRRSLATLIFVVALGGMSYWYVQYTKGAKSGKRADSNDRVVATGAEFKLADPDSNLGSKSNYERIMNRGVRAELVSLLTDSSVVSRNTEPIATRVEKINKRKSIVERLESLPDSSQDAEFITRSKISIFIESASIAHQYSIDNSKEIDAIDKLLSKGIESAEQSIRSLSKMGSVVSKIRRLKIADELKDEKLEETAELIYTIAEADPNNEEMAKGFSDFLSIVWNKEKYNVSGPLCKAFYQGFANTKRDKISNLVAKVQKVVAEHELFLKGVKESKAVSE